jgi:hypothetical protein
MYRIALGLCTGIMHNIHKNFHKADAYFSSSVVVVVEIAVNEISH